MVLLPVIIGLTITLEPLIAFAVVTFVFADAIAVVFARVQDTIIDRLLTIEPYINPSIDLESWTL